MTRIAGGAGAAWATTGRPINVRTSKLNAHATVFHLPRAVLDALDDVAVTNLEWVAESTGLYLAAAAGVIAWLVETDEVVQLSDPTTFRVRTDAELASLRDRVLRELWDSPSGKAPRRWIQMTTRDLYAQAMRSRGTLITYRRGGVPIVHGGPSCPALQGARCEAQVLCCAASRQGSHRWFVTPARLDAYQGGARLCRLEDDPLYQ